MYTCQPAPAAEPCPLAGDKGIWRGCRGWARAPYLAVLVAHQLHRLQQLPVLEAEADVRGLRNALLSICHLDDP